MWTNCADVKITSFPSTTPSIYDDVDCASSPTKEPTTYNPTPSPSALGALLTPSPSTLGVICPPAYTGIRPYESCTMYFHCNDGEIVADVQHCPSGTLFDTTYNYCNWAHEVTCENTLSQVEPEPASLTTQSKGCYSNNYKTCNHPDFQSDNDSCNSAWLPNGEQHNCIALWGECTGKSSSCCQPAICYGDSQYAQCRPST